ncbi:MAG: heparan-alpha-glucosaminide N-acetyltransferase domain-containing protein [Candidatus Hodarchaeota archaeon]
MKRLKSIDIFRGICMFIMVYGHMFDWWLRIEDYWFFDDVLKPLLGPIGAVGFVFISGISTGLSYKKNSLKAKNSDFSMRNLRDIYIVRALLLLLIALIYNLTVAIRLNDLTFIWAWLILQTISISLLISYPLLKFSKITRLIISLTFLVGNQFFLWWLLPFKGQLNFFGILFHILYNPVEHYVIVPFFSIFLIGTVIGDLILDINLINSQIERREIFKNKLIFYMLLFGTTSTLIGVLYFYPNFFIYGTYSSVIYSFGIVTCLFAGLITLEEYEILKTKKNYRYLYYYSYYSFSVYIIHNLLYFLFVGQLTIITIWIPILLIIPLLGLLLKMIYKYLGMKASLKALMSVASYLIVTKITAKKASKKKLL